jgi:predicted transcriptional regulator
MKITLTIPDRLAEDVDKLAKRLGKPRAQFLTEAIAQHVARHRAELAGAARKGAARKGAKPAPAPEAIEEVSFSRAETNE